MNFWRMNKKSQFYGPPRSPYRGLSPILILSLMMLIIPLILNVIGNTFSSITNTIIYAVGGVGLIIGVIHTIYNKFNDLPGDCF